MSAIEKLNLENLRKVQDLKKLCARAAKFMYERGFHPGSHAGPKSEHATAICQLFRELFDEGNTYYYNIDGDYKFKSLKELK